MDHLDGQANREALEWEGVVYTPSALLDCANVTFHLRDVLVIRHSIKQCQLYIGQIAAERLELTVHQNGCNDETALPVNT
jgi:hypothetical protein